HLLLIVLVCTVFFFFQAEDGIRDFHVTGVQTCALPISAGSTSRAGGSGEGTTAGSRNCTPSPEPTITGDTLAAVGSRSRISTNSSHISRRSCWSVVRGTGKRISLSPRSVRRNRHPRIDESATENMLHLVLNSTVVERPLDIPTPDTLHIRLLHKQHRGGVSTQPPKLQR